MGASRGRIFVIIVWGLGHRARWIGFRNAAGRRIGSVGDLGRPAQHKQVRQVEQPLPRARGRDQESPSQGSVGVAGKRLRLVSGYSLTG